MSRRRRPQRSKERPIAAQGAVIPQSFPPETRDPYPTGPNGIPAVHDTIIREALIGGIALMLYRRQPITDRIKVFRATYPTTNNININGNSTIDSLADTSDADLTTALNEVEYWRFLSPLAAFIYTRNGLNACYEQAQQNVDNNIKTLQSYLQGKLVAYTTDRHQAAFIAHLRQHHPDILNSTTDTNINVNDNVNDNDRGNSND
jgi:hypothetical protein